MASRVTASLSGATIGAGSSSSGTGLVGGVYVVTKAAASDFFTVPDFTAIHYLNGKLEWTENITASVDSTTANKVTFSPSTTVGVCTCWIVGTPD